MEATEITDEADIIFSDSAASRVAQLIKEEKNSELRLRVYITGGGCSGFSYGFTFDENLKEGESKREIFDADNEKISGLMGKDPHKQRDWTIIGTSAEQGVGMYEGVFWLAEILGDKYDKE